MRLNFKSISLFFVFAVVTFLILAFNRCGYPRIDESSVQLHTEAEKVLISCGSVPLGIWFYDSTKDLADLRPVSGSAYLWNDSECHRLVVQGIYFNGCSKYDPKTGRLGSIGFYMNFDGAPAQHAEPPFKAGTYNLSIAMNGVAGIHTLCGSFTVSKRIRFPDNRDLH